MSNEADFHLPIPPIDQRGRVTSCGRPQLQKKRNTWDAVNTVSPASSRLSHNRFSEAGEFSTSDSLPRLPVRDPGWPIMRTSSLGVPAVGIYVVPTWHVDLSGNGALQQIALIASPPDTLSIRSARCRADASQVNRSRTRCRPASPIARASAGLSITWLMARASALASPRATNIPVCPCSTISGMPPLRVATMGSPQAAAS